MTRSNEEPLQQGTEVREQQELIRLPTAKEMIADVKVHESLLEKVRIGLPVRITTEALPGRTFGGRVSKISLLPDATSSYLNPDLKVYNTEIAIDGDAEDMRPGMSCSAEIIIDQLPEAVYVPVQSVMRVAGKPTVWVLPPNAEKPVAKAIETGMDNNRFIVVTSGLQVGEQVLLAPPLPASSVRESRLVSKPPGGSTPSTGSGKSIVKPDKSAADAPAPKTPKVKVAN
jgi:HlyD family secretion protein